MGKSHKHRENGLDHHSYEHQLKHLQIRLSAAQRQIIASGRRALVIFEGRDAAGKDGTIKRIVEYMSPRDTRVVALGVPSAQDQRAWYFQRWCAHLPLAGEITFFNRSWYNRAGVERVMGFCTEQDYAAFIETAPMFEQLLVHSGVELVKYYLDISKKEQKRRLADREEDPLKQWKNSPMDACALAKWKAYSKARDAMLARTHTVFAPWTIVRADNKPAARLAVIRDLIARLAPDAAPDEHDLPDPTLTFLYDHIAHEKGWLAT